jgi:hypothetical protein
MDLIKGWPNKILYISHFKTDIDLNIDLNIVLKKLNLYLSLINE